MFELVRWLHVLLFGLWLGTDYGTFLSSRVLMDPTRPVAVRTTAARMMVLFDVGPRVALVLILPAGLTLASWMGALGGGPALRIGAWVAALAWLAVLLVVELAEESPLREPLRRLDLAWRVVLAIALAAVGVLSLAGGEPVRSEYLAWKVLLFAAILAMGIMIRLRLRAFGPAFGAAMAESTDQTEAVLRSALYRTYPFVMSIWVLVLAAGWIGVANP